MGSEAEQPETRHSWVTAGFRITQNQQLARVIVQILPQAFGGT